MVETTLNGRMRPSHGQYALWRMLEYLRPLIITVCRAMDRRQVRRHGQPVIVSAHGIVRLWSMQFGDIARSGFLWRLSDGTELPLSSRVLDFHIASEALCKLRLEGCDWSRVIKEEFASIARELQGRDEVALVGTTILRRQAMYFGAEPRRVPVGLYTNLDTFYRRLILLVFHPGGAARVLKEREPVVEAAISRKRFIELHGARE